MSHKDQKQVRQTSTETSPQPIRAITPLQRPVPSAKAQAFADSLLSGSPPPTELLSYLVNRVRMARQDRAQRAQLLDEARRAYVDAKTNYHRLSGIADQAAVDIVEVAREFLSLPPPAPSQHQKEGEADAGKEVAGSA